MTVFIEVTATPGVIKITGQHIGIALLIAVVNGGRSHRGQGKRNDGPSAPEGELLILKRLRRLTLVRSFVQVEGTNGAPS